MTFERVWTASTGSPDGPPVVAGGWSGPQLGSSGLYGMNPTTGRVVLERSTAALEHFATPSVGDRMLFVHPERRGGVEHFGLRTRPLPFTSLTDKSVSSLTSAQPCRAPGSKMKSSGAEYSISRSPGRTNFPARRRSAKRVVTAAWMGTVQPTGCCTGHWCHWETGKSRPRLAQTHRVLPRRCF